MNREDIIRMAQEAQMPFYWRTGEITYLDKLERFAELVASAERERIKQANAPEIERINAYIKEALAQPERSMKVEGPLHVVCQCDKCKAQPEQKPMHPQLKAMLEEYFDKCFSESAPQRKPLTNEEIEVLLSEYKPAYAWFQFARAIEAAHGIKGEA